MPIHDWTRVDAGIFHHFHSSWMNEIQRCLNQDLLPDDYYALAEQKSGPFGPDVLTLQSTQTDSESGTDPTTPSLLSPGVGGVLVAEPQVELTAEADLEFYRRRQNMVAVRHASGDEMIAVVEIVSRGNKSSLIAIRSLIEKAAELLTNGIHLILVDVQPPTTRDPDGIHGRLWNEMTGQVYPHPAKPLTLAAYDASPIGATRAFVQAISVGDTMPDMPLFLRPGVHIPLPLQSTYDRAFDAVPRRWSRLLLDP